MWTEFIIELWSWVCLNMAAFYCNKKSSSVRAAAKQHMGKGLDLNLPPTLHVEIICRAVTEIILMTGFTPVSSSDNWMPRINCLTASPCQADPLQVLFPRFISVSCLCLVALPNESMPLLCSTLHYLFVSAGTRLGKPH